MNNTIKDLFKDYFLIHRLKDIRHSNGIPRITPDKTYSTGNFSILRDKHAYLQLDSINGTNHRLDTILTRTNWPKNYFKDKFILECGCGAGPDTEILLNLGAKVLSVDIAGLEVAHKNIGENPNSQFLQASLLDLPLNENCFDIVFCHRVIQHTPDPEQVLKNILKYVKDDGGVFVHSYAKSWFQMLRWKYFIRPITKRLPSEFLYKIIEKTAPLFFIISNALRKIGKVGNAINHFFLPFLNYRHILAFENKNDDWIIEYGIHDTFDALSPKYDKPLSEKKIKLIATEILNKKAITYEIMKTKSITLLRSVNSIELN